MNFWEVASDTLVSPRVRTVMPRLSVFLWYVVSVARNHDVKLRYIPGLAKVHRVEDVICLVLVVDEYDYAPRVSKFV